MRRTGLSSVYHNIFQVFFISAYATIAQDKCTKEILGYPMYDITSSSLTHSVNEKHMSHPEFFFNNLVESVISNLVTYDIPEEKHFDYWYNNFGLIEMCWDDSMENLKQRENGFSTYSKLFDHENNYLSMNIMGKNGETIYNKKLAYSDLVNKNYSQDTEKN